MSNSPFIYGPNGAQNLTQTAISGGFAPLPTITVTAAGTTTLTSLSNQTQIFTGTTTQTIILPVATTLSIGQTYLICNQSTAAIALQFNGGTPFSDASGKGYSSVAAGNTLWVSAQTIATSAGTWAAAPFAAPGLGAPGPTIQRFLSSTGTYTTPANVAFINVQLVGGGGGGSGAGTAAGTAASAGGSTTFGSSFLTAGGGAQGVWNTGSAGAGGTNTANSGGSVIVNIPGSTGGGGSYVASSATNLGGGSGGSSFFGGSGGGGYTSTIGLAGATNSGGGGGGGGAGGTSTSVSGSGGGSGGYLDVLITAPAATYTYSIGTAGTAGGAGTNGNAGGAGGSGVVIVTEYYYNGVGAMAGNGGAYTPTTDVLTGSGTYTVKANASYITVEMVGGGAGGSGSGVTSTMGVGGAGGNTTFGTTLLAANGAPATGSNGGAGAGGTASLGSGPVGKAFSGAGGVSGSTTTTGGTDIAGGAGASSPFGGGAPGGGPQGGGAAAVTATGSGGSGAGTNGGATQQYGGGGGGAGGYVFATIVSPLTSYSYSVGAAGAAGTAGTTGNAGGAGATGTIIVTTYYMNGAVGTATGITGSVNSSQVLGTTAVGNAPAGFIGEFVSANPGSPVTPTTSGNYINITSISLTAGDWDVEGVVNLNTAATTTATRLVSAVSTSTGASDSSNNGGINVLAFAFPVSSNEYTNISRRRINVSSTTTVYLVGQLTYVTLSTATYGTDSFISARRVR